MLRRRSVMRAVLASVVSVGAGSLVGCGDSESYFENYTFPRSKAESGRYLSDEEQARLREDWQAKQQSPTGQPTPASGTK